MNGLRTEIRFQQFRQWLFRRQWDPLARTTRTSTGIQIIGDIPIFVAHRQRRCLVEPRYVSPR